MIKQDLIKALRNHKGKLYVWVSGENDGFDMAVEKQDLMKTIARFPDGEETYWFIKGKFLEKECNR